MGTVCSKSKDNSDKYDLFSGSYNIANRSIPQIGFLGLKGVGKSTFFYSLSIPNWTTIDSEQLEDDVAVRYEELKLHGRNGAKIGIWELGGSPATIDLWPFMYHYIQFDALVYIVDIKPKNKVDGLVENVDRITKLMIEADLSSTEIIVLLNPFDKPLPRSETASVGPDELYLRQLKADIAVRIGPSAKRIRWAMINAKELATDENWPKLCDSVFRSAVSRFEKRNAVA